MLRVDAASFEQKGPVPKFGTGPFLSSDGLSLVLDAAELRVEIERLSIENTYLKPLSEKPENTYYSAKFYAGGP